jgi:membrane fusion protein, multidrug efflux system
MTCSAAKGAVTASTVTCSPSPEDAIQHGQLFVYVIDEQNHAAVRPVKVARQNATTAVISEGLSGGEQAVTRGELLLQPGALVAIDAGRGS